MGEIRKFTEEHLPEVAVLYLRAMRGHKQAVQAPEALVQYFREILLQNPWAAPDLPSLVYFDGAAIVGFLGVVPRPVEFKGRPLRMAVATQFMVDRDRHKGPAAMELMYHFFRGPQDLSFSDGAWEDAYRIWAGVGGHGASSYSFNWLRPLRPLRTLGNYADRMRGASRLAAKAVVAALSPVEYLLSKMPVAALREPVSPYEAKPVDADGLLRCILELGWREPLKPVYEPEAFRWLIREAASAKKRVGELILAALYDPAGVLSGWYVYTAIPGGAATLLQIGVRRREGFDAVLLALFRDAWRRGCSSVKGQSIPQYLANLTKHYCLFRYPDTSVLFHSRDKEIEDTILRGKAALTGLDGERWMRFSAEPWV